MNMQMVVADERLKDDVGKVAFELGGVVSLNNKKMKALPYSAWSNRGIGKMKV